MEDRINYQIQKENEQDNSMIISDVKNENDKEEEQQDIEDDVDEDELDKKKETQILNEYNQVTTSHIKLTDSNYHEANSNLKQSDPQSKSSLYYIEELSTDSKYTYRVVYPVDSNL